MGGRKEKQKRCVCVGDEETGPVSPLTYESITQWMTDKRTVRKGTEHNVNPPPPPPPVNCALYPTHNQMVEEWEREAKAVKTLYNENWIMEIQHSEWLARSDPDTATNGQMSLTRKSIRNVCLKRQKESQVRQTKNRPEKMPLPDKRNFDREYFTESKQHFKKKKTYKKHPRHFAWRKHIQKTPSSFWMTLSRGTTPHSHNNFSKRSRYRDERVKTHRWKKRRERIIWKGKK